MSLKFSRIQPWTAELAALDQFKKSFIREYSKYLMTCCQVSNRCPLGYLFGVGVSCCILYSIVSYSYVNGSGSITSVGEERAICLLLFTCNYVVSVWRGFLFLWVLGMGYVILLWHSLSLPYNHFVIWICKKQVFTLSWSDDASFINSFFTSHKI